MNYLRNIAYFDDKLLQAVISFRGEYLNIFFLYFTYLGSWPVITLLFICVSFVFYHFNKINLILPLFFALLGSGLLTVLLKYLTNRNRPSIIFAMYTEKLQAFPSAHAALSTTLFGFMIYCLWKYSFGLKIKIILTIILLALIILIGFSRIYLGVHFTSDVVGGYLVGVLLLLITIYISKRLSIF